MGLRISGVWWLPRWVRYPLYVVVTLYLGICALLATFQSLLIFPGQVNQGQPSSLVQPSPNEELIHLKTATGDRIVALFGKALTADGTPRTDASSVPTLLYFYGNGDCLRHAGRLMDAFRRLGFNVMMPEYVGYGMSEGKAGEAGCYATADAALAHLKARKDVAPDRIVAGGWSLGSAVAIDLARREPTAGLIAFSGFTSMLDMARRNYPILPTNLLLRHRFESEAKLRHIACPVLIGHGRLDRLIPYEMADRLAAAPRGLVTRFEVERADHGDFYLVGEDQILRAMSRFLSELDREVPPL